MTTTDRARSGSVVALLIVVAALGVAACGGSSSTRSVAVASCLGRSGHASTLAARIGCQFDPMRMSCLEKHGVLSAGAGSTVDTLASRIYDPKYVAVLRGCGVDLPPGFGRPSTTAIDAFVPCVARNGYKLPAPNTSGKGRVFPAVVTRNSAFPAAAKNCASIIEKR